jgi:hypothetical protein
MNEVLELQSGQVAFISSLMAGFSFSIAVQIIRLNIEGRIATLSFLLFCASGLAFLIALYIDVSLSLRVVGITQYSDSLIENISYIRRIGTTAASSAFFIFTLSIGMVGWLQSRLTGIVSSFFALSTLSLLIYSRHFIITLQAAS